MCSRCLRWIIKPMEGYMAEILRRGPLASFLAEAEAIGAELKSGLDGK